MRFDGIVTRSAVELANISLNLIQGAALLHTPYLNRGSAFTQEEREQFGLKGLLPSHVQSLSDQVKRAYAQYSSRANDLAKNTFMTSMKEQNEVLYYRVCRSPVWYEQALTGTLVAHLGPP